MGFVESKVSGIFTDRIIVARIFDNVVNNSGLHSFAARSTHYQKFKEAVLRLFAEFTLTQAAAVLEIVS